jgi:hypothetical protein
MHLHRLAALLGALPLFAAPALSQAAAPVAAPSVAAAVDALIEEGTERSQVWATLEDLCHGIGPRLTGSAGLERASVWARGRFQDYGLSNAHLWKWGEVPVRFDRGPSSVKMVAPEEVDFEFTTRAWGPGTDGPLRARVVKMPTTLEELEAVKADLPGAWILEGASARRRRGRGEGDEETDRDEARKIRETIAQAIEAAEIAGKLQPSRNDSVVTGGVRNWLELTMDTLPTDRAIAIRKKDAAVLEKHLGEGAVVELEADLVHWFTEGPFPVFDVVAEIPGTEFPDEVVIISAHLDSWNGPGSQGCQDNGTGATVMIEAARILAATGVQPRRTIRVCLWSGEEQGLHGSRKYAEWLQESGQLDGVSACFVDDGGTGYQGGLVCTEAMEPMLSEAIAAVNERFPEMPISVTVQDKMPSGGSSDHASFNRLGVPGFYWTEKGLTGREARDYRFVWHTQNDTTRYAVEDNLVQSAVCSAVTAFNLAMADTLLPRYVEPAEEEEPKEEAGVVEAGAAKSDGPLNGTWTCEVTEGDMEGWSFELSFQHLEGGAVSGSLTVMGSGGPLTGVTWDAEAKTLKAQYESESYGTFDYEVKIGEDGKVTGTSKTARNTMPFKASPKKKGESA